MHRNVGDYLTKRQNRADEKRAGGTLEIEVEWKGARKTKPLKAVAAVLQRMMGARERCMYCVDSHGDHGLLGWCFI